MEEKKSIKVSLGTAVCVIIIVLLICGMIGMWYYYNYMQKPQNSNQINNTQQVNDTNNITTETSEQKHNIIMNKGVDIANAKPGIYSFIYQGAKYEDYYNTTYDIYENGKNQGKTEGKVVETTMMDEKGYRIKYDKKDSEAAKNCIFVSCDYNVIPREYENVTNIPEKIKNDFIDCDDIQMQSIDLDGNGNKEYVVIYSKKESDPVNQYDKGTEEKGVYLYDSDYKRISMIAIQRGIIKDYSSHVANFDGISYIDIDNDGNMEMVIDIPVAASYYRFGIYKYNGNSVEGQIDSFTSAG